MQATPEQRRLKDRKLMMRLRNRKVREILSHKRSLVAVPYSATLADTINTLVANRVVAVPVAAPPGQWIGAGGSMILEADKLTGAVRKHYIGIVTMLDILAHIAGDESVNGGHEAADVDGKLSAPVSTIIGHCLEGLSLWTLHPNTSVLDCMEVFSKGIHRAMVPMDSQETTTGVELVEAASTYRMLTQMDVIKFLRVHAQQDFQDILSRTVRDSGGLTTSVFAVTNRTKAIDAIKCMRSASLLAVPVVEGSDLPQEAHSQLINGFGRMLLGTFSATDIRGCPISVLRPWLQLNVIEFTARVFENPSLGAPDLVNSPRLLVTCYPDSLLTEVIDKVVSTHVHRVWVTSENGALLGLVSLTDIIRAVRSVVIEESL